MVPHGHHHHLFWLAPGPVLVAVVVMVVMVVVVVLPLLVAWNRLKQQAVAYLQHLGYSIFELGA